MFRLVTVYSKRAGVDGYVEVHIICPSGAVSGVSMRQLFEDTNQAVTRIRGE